MATSFLKKPYLRIWVMRHLIASSSQAISQENKTSQHYQETVTNNCDMWHVLPRLSITCFGKLLGEEFVSIHVFLSGDGFDALFPPANNYVLIFVDLMSAAPENVWCGKRRWQNPPTIFLSIQYVIQNPFAVCGSMPSFWITNTFFFF